MNIVPIDSKNKKSADILFVCMSFENIRWKAYLEENKSNYTNIIIFYNKEFIDFYKDHISDYVNDSRCKLVETSIDNPISTADCYINIIDKYEQKLIDIDCSTFTHEHLLILFKVFEFLEYKHTINIIYTTVDEYSVGKHNGWLSKGVKEIRNILGYSGNMIPSKQLHLIVLVGLENERLEKIITEYEPNKITIGKCTKESSFSDNISELNRKHYADIDNFMKKVISNLSDSEEFEFSCSVPEETYMKLNEIIKKNEDYNNIIIAGNSKISTLGVMKLALENETLQLCYAQPIEYNLDSYTQGVKDFKYYEIEIN